MHSNLSLSESFYLSTFFTHQSNTHSFCSVIFKLLLLLYFNKKSYSFRPFSYTASFLLNHIPNTILSALTYMVLRRNLKTYLFNQAFTTGLFPLAYDLAF